ncbi:hypothetical protein FRB94_008858 [Tulasnella sp. JGI-2019a]|nr:hypothetical protein FRB93_002797 [Tulasnella sp. JGI-2019a]KAG8995704.1 hypothetical protein FRB94_008858 [Tulasnella sp. JGI-2019a]
MIFPVIGRSNAKAREQALAAPRQEGIPAPRHPIVLVHGLFGYDTLFGITTYWHDIPEALAAAGAEVLVARVPSTSSVETRASHLAAQIASIYSGRSVHLIGHSMGGLDCRYLVTKLLDGAGFRVLSVTTISTPHRGSPLADLKIVRQAAKLPGIHRAMNKLPFGDGDGQAYACLTTEKAHVFNAYTPDVAGVHYFSWGASFNPGPLDVIGWGACETFLHALEGPNDGAVSVSSAKWGEYLGTVYGVNHTELIGHKVYPCVLRGETDLFDHKDFFVKHASMLAQKVEV